MARFDGPAAARQQAYFGLTAGLTAVQNALL